tara:strand:+ start:2041 stop:3303 length:1263 start_codon:yes stop_codon:yes gene_type:complete
VFKVRTLARTHAYLTAKKEFEFVDHHSLNILSLCAGVGGLDLGIRVAQPNARAVCFVEIEAFACEILATRMEDKSLDEAPVWTDLRSFDGKPWRGVVDCITAGYPCQPFSIAGKQKGKDDPRHLWPDVYRIVREIRPRLCFFENVPGHLRLGFEQVHDDLRELGYSVKAGLFSAEEVGASHKRERLFILAYRESDRANGWLSQLKEIQRTDGCGHATEPAGSSEASLANSPCLFCEWPLPEGDPEQQSEMPSGSISGELADTDGTRLQETRSEFIAERTGGDIGQLGNAEHAGSSACQIARGDGQADGAEWPACRQIPTEQSAGADHVANCDGAGFQKQCGAEPICAEHQAVECGSCLPFPPGPEGDWDGIPAGLKPAICRMADGLANRVDRIRACGNGVVPLAAAYAWGVLTTAANGGK